MYQKDADDFGGITYDEPTEEEKQEANEHKKRFTEMSKKMSQVRERPASKNSKGTTASTVKNMSAVNFAVKNESGANVSEPTPNSSVTDASDATTDSKSKKISVLPDTK